VLEVRRAAGRRRWMRVQGAPCARRNPGKGPSPVPAVRRSLGDPAGRPAARHRVTGGAALAPAAPGKKDTPADAFSHVPRSNYAFLSKIMGWAATELVISTRSPDYGQARRHERCVRNWSGAGQSLTPAPGRQPDRWHSRPVRRTAEGFGRRWRRRGVLHARLRRTRAVGWLLASQTSPLTRDGR